MRISDWSSDVCSSDLHIDAIGGYATAANDRNIGSSIDVALSPQIVAHLDGSWRKTGDTRSGGYVYAPDIRGDLLHLAEHKVEEGRTEEPTSELQTLMRISYDVCCWKKKARTCNDNTSTNH